MIYKLFMYGQKEAFSIVEIPNDMFLHGGEVICLGDKRYQVLHMLRRAIPLEFNSEGKRKYPSWKDDKESVMNAPLSELIVTELPDL